jgi:hypothetical protein
LVLKRKITACFIPISARSRSRPLLASTPGKPCGLVNTGLSGYLERVQIKARQIDPALDEQMGNLFSFERLSKAPAATQQPSANKQPVVSQSPQLTK